MARYAHDIICALATPPQASAIGVVRVSGAGSIALVNTLFRGKDLIKEPGHTAHLGHLIQDGEDLDQVLVLLFRAPRSYTREESVEISAHGNPHILNRIMQALIQAGARPAGPGEFTQRAFLNGALDLAQAEAVSDLIQANSKAAKDLALFQLKGGLSARLQELSTRLTDFLALLELELDFSEEDVAFANRNELEQLLNQTLNFMQPLLHSFTQGLAIKEGIPVVIAGKPNAGKSTLLNALLQEEKALVSDIPGTTRDVIEDVIHIQGLSFRLMDTAGIRQTRDKVEAMGVERTLQKVRSSAIILYLFDPADTAPQEYLQTLSMLQQEGGEKARVLGVANKTDRSMRSLDPQKYPHVISISALKGEGLDSLQEGMLQASGAHSLTQDQLILTNARHFQALDQARQHLLSALKLIQDQTSTEFISLEIRHVLHALGQVTGQVVPEDVLKTIFGRFCIGK